MSTDKKPITFYASEAVQFWYKSLPPQAGSREINRLLEKAIERYEPAKPLDERVAALENERTQGWWLTKALCNLLLSRGVFTQAELDKAKLDAVYEAATDDRTTT